MSGTAKTEQKEASHIVTEPERVILSRDTPRASADLGFWAYWLVRWQRSHAG
jgi:hypothetical protein